MTSTLKSITNQKLFLRQFVDNYFHIGAILPSSGALGRAGAAYLAHKQGSVRVLEAGAGTGSFTREIVPLLSAGDSLDVVEINSGLMAYLKQRFEREAAFQPAPGVEINFINADIRSLGPVDYDYIVFSLPLTNFPLPLAREILTLMIDRLKPGGVFSYVRYVFVSRLKYLFGGAAVQTEMAAKEALLDDFAGRYQIDRRMVLLNVPPTWVYYWQKPATVQ